MFFLGLALGLGVYGAYVLSKCFFRVEEGHLAVLSTFGAAELEPGSEHKLKTFPPGLHSKLPWQHVHDVPVMEQNLDLSGEEGGQTAMAADGTILRFDSILRYEPVRQDLYSFLFGLRAPVEHITGLFTCLLRNEIANFGTGTKSTAISITKEKEHGGSYALIRQERSTLNQRIEEFCRSKIGARYGVQFNAVDLVDVLPPDELANALNAVIHAQTEADAAYARAESDCQQRVLAAESGVEIAQAKARATELEITKLGSYLHDLARQDTLSLYVARRRSEVTSEARLVYLKEKQ